MNIPPPSYKLPGKGFRISIGPEFVLNLRKKLALISLASLKIKKMSKNLAPKIIGIKKIVSAPLTGQWINDSS